MAYRLQVQIPDELAEAVKEAARADRRSMASWVALRLEEAVAGVARGENPHLPPDYRAALEALSPVASTSNIELPAHPRMVGDSKIAVQGPSAVELTERSMREMADRSIALGGDPDCQHPKARVEKRSTSFGIRRFCGECDQFLS